MRRILVLNGASRPTPTLINPVPPDVISSLIKKLAILLEDPFSIPNEKTELIGKCRHKNKLKLKSFFQTPRASNPFFSSLMIFFIYIGFLFSILHHLTVRIDSLVSVQ